MVNSDEDRNNDDRTGHGAPNHDPTQIFQPLRVTEPSEFHVMSVVGVTPLGPLEPIYTCPFSLSLSKLFSVLKDVTDSGDEGAVIVQLSRLLYLPG